MRDCKLQTSPYLDIFLLLSSQDGNQIIYDKKPNCILIRTFRVSTRFIQRGTGPSHLMFSIDRISIEWAIDDR